MLRFAALVLVGTFLVSSVRGGDDDAKKALKDLEGTWNATSVIWNGKEYPTGNQGLQFVIKGDEATVRGSKSIEKEYARLKLTLTPNTTPRLLDLTITSGIQKDAKMEGIYELKGDEFKMCVKVFGQDRPAGFEAPEGSATALVVMKREKQ
jgi:uncharacterized protein (TIGR03067 family)